MASLKVPFAVVVAGGCVCGFVLVKLNWPVCGSIGAWTLLAGPMPHGDEVPEKKKKLTTYPALTCRLSPAPLS